MGKGKQGSQRGMGKGKLSNSPMFFHQLKQRDAQAFGVMISLPMEERLKPSACIECVRPANLSDAILFPEKYLNLATSKSTKEGEVRGSGSGSGSGRAPVETVVKPF